MSDDLCQPYTGRLVPSETTDSTNPKLAKADEENCSIHGPFYSGYPECPFCMAGGLIGSHATGGQEEAVEPRAEPYFIAEMRRVCTQSKQNELVKFSVYTEDVGQALYEFDLRGPRIPPPDDEASVFVVLKKRAETAEAALKVYQMLFTQAEIRDRIEVLNAYHPWVPKTTPEVE